MMAKYHLVWICLIVFASCKEISFREPQPKGRKALTTVPKKLQGMYLPVQLDGSLSRDTVIITRHGYRFGYYDGTVASSHQTHFEEGGLSDSLVLKAYRGYYFLNLYEDPEWLLRVIRQEKDGDLVYMAMEQTDVDFKDYIIKLSDELPVDSVKADGEVQYYIQPSPAKLVELIEKGYFSQTVLKRIR